MSRKPDELGDFSIPKMVDFVARPNSNCGNFITFGDGGKRFSAASKRLVREAKRSGLFSSVERFDLADVASFQGTLESDLKFINDNHNRGLGYWLWKALLLREVVRVSAPGTKIIYVDAGCELNRRAKGALSQLEECWGIAETQGVALTSTEYRSVDYTKDEIFAHLGTVPDSHQRQFAATVIFIVVNDKSKFIIDRWLEMCRYDLYRLLDDSKLEVKFNSAVVENRYDQSILSAICHEMNLDPLPIKIDFGSGYWSWRRIGQESFIWASRNTRGIPRFAWPRVFLLVGWGRFRLERAWRWLKLVWT